MRWHLHVLSCISVNKKIIKVFESWLLKWAKRFVHQCNMHIYDFTLKNWLRLRIITDQHYLFDDQLWLLWTDMHFAIIFCMIKLFTKQEHASFGSTIYNTEMHWNHLYHVQIFARSLPTQKYDSLENWNFRHCNNTFCLVISHLY
jgi:hypothetical protein